MALHITCDKSLFSNPEDIWTKIKQVNQEIIGKTDKSQKIIVNLQRQMEVMNVNKQATDTLFETLPSSRYSSLNIPIAFLALTTGIVWIKLLDNESCFLYKPLFKRSRRSYLSHLWIIVWWI